MTFSLRHVSKHEPKSETSSCMRICIRSSVGRSRMSGIPISDKSMLATQYSVLLSIYMSASTGHRMSVYGTFGEDRKIVSASSRCHSENLKIINDSSSLHIKNTYLSISENLHILGKFSVLPQAAPALLSPFISLALSSQTRSHIV